MELPLDVKQALLDLKQIPYENLSKIVAFWKNPQWNEVLDTTEKLQRKALELGAGGTCYSLTFSLKEKLEGLGYPCYYVTAHKGQKKNIHCGLIMDYANKKYLMDPGYMIFEALHVPPQGSGLFFEIRPNGVFLENAVSEAGLKLFTGRPGNFNFRFLFDLRPLSEEEFFNYWKSSFYFEMMDYPVLNKLIGEKQYYLQKSNLMVRTVNGSQMQKLNKNDFINTVENIYGISAELTDDFLSILQKKNIFLF